MDKQQGFLLYNLGDLGLLNFIMGENRFYFGGQLHNDLAGMEIMVYKLFILASLSRHSIINPRLYFLGQQLYLVGNPTVPWLVGVVIFVGHI